MTSSCAPSRSTFPTLGISNIFAGRPRHNRATGAESAHRGEGIDIAEDIPEAVVEGWSVTPGGKSPRMSLIMLRTRIQLGATSLALVPSRR